MSFFSSLMPWRKRDTLAVILDISSGSVHGALVLLSATDKPKILFAHRTNIPVQDRLSDLPRYTDHMIRALGDCLSILDKKGRPHLRIVGYGRKEIAETYITLSSPWCASETKVFAKEYQKPASVSVEFLKRFLREEKKTFEEKRDRRGNLHAHIIEDKILRVKLNGYYVDSPDGKKASMVEVLSFMTVVDRTLHEKIRTVVMRHFPDVIPVQHSFALAAFAVTRDLFPRDTNFLHIHVDDELTDIAVIRHEALVEHISFPLGRNGIVRTIGTHLGMPAGTAQSALSIHERGHFAEDAQGRVGEATEKGLSLWYEELKKASMSLTQELQAPKTIFMLVDEPEQDIFLRKLRKEKNLYTIGAGEYLQIIPQSANLFRKSVPDSKPAGHDPALYVATLFAEKLSKQV